MSNGDVIAEPLVAHEPAPSVPGTRRKVVEAMPAVASCAVAASGTEPRRSAAAAGESSVTLFGAVASIFTVAVLSAEVTPARFVAW